MKGWNIMEDIYFWKNEKVTLRMIEKSDSEMLGEYLKDTKSRIQADHGIALPVTEQVSEDMADFAVESSNEGEELWFAIMDEHNDMAGYAVVDWFCEENANVQFNINIFKEYRRCGYATAASHIIFDYLFYERRFHKIGCCVLEGNVEGEAFVRSIGLCKDAFRDEMFFTNGRYIGEYYYSILRSEYDRIKESSYNRDLMKRENYEWPVSSQGELPQGYVKDGKLVNRPANPGAAREYFWEYDGILLRDMTEEDYQRNHNIIYDTQACIFFDSEVKLPIVKDELSEFEKSHLGFECNDDRIEFAICNTEGDYVGNINICGLDKKNGKFSYSIYVLKEHRGNGYGTRALRLLLWYCFNELRMNKMICGVNEGNVGSAMVMRKVGCRPEGILRENEYYNGKFVDLILFGVTREEFMRFNRFDEQLQ